MTHLDDARLHRHDAARLRRLRDAALWVAIVATLVNLTLDVLAGRYHLAGLECALNAGLVGALRVSVCLEQLFTAKLTKACADADIATFTYETVVQQMKEGRVQLDVGLSPAMKH
jgi:hypothetical protein